VVQLLACLLNRLRSHWEEELSDEVRQLRALQPDHDDGAAATGGENPPDGVCSTVDCLGRRAAQTFEPCSRLTLTQCSTLVRVLEGIVSTNPDVAEVDTPSQRFRHLFATRRRDGHVTADRSRTKRHVATMTTEPETNQTGSVSTRDNGVTSSRTTSGDVGRRTRRSADLHGVPFRQINPDTREIIDEYMQWRAQNGYGRVSGRWG